MATRRNGRFPRVEEQLHLFGAPTSRAQVAIAEYLEMIAGHRAAPVAQPPAERPRRSKPKPKAKAPLAPRRREEVSALRRREAALLAIRPLNQKVPAGNFELAHRKVRRGTEIELRRLYRDEPPNKAARTAGPVTLRIVDDEPDRWVVWDGVHRWRAARAHKATAIPALVKVVSPGGELRAEVEGQIRWD